MKTLTRKITWLPLTSHGWGNGYVIIPKGHPMHGKGYNDIPVDVHGGLTFSVEIDSDMVEEGDWDLSEGDVGGWLVGFDTAHFGDDIATWSKFEVEKETLNLKKQLIKLAK